MAQSTVRFGLGQKFDTGTAPTVVGLNNNDVFVETHETDNMFSSDLMFHAGTVNQDGITWGNSFSHTTGRNPAVAINDFNLVIEVHENSSGGHIYYSLGVADGANHSISWWTTGGVSLTGGTNPSVAINNAGIFVITYRNSGTLYYCVGSANSVSKTVQTHSSYAVVTNMNTGNATPCIAINNCNDYIITYQDYNQNLCYRAGVVGSTTLGAAIDSGIFDSASSQPYVSTSLRREPSVAINDNRVVIITAYSADGNGKPCVYNALWSSGSSLTFDVEKVTEFDNGTITRVAASTKYAMQVHFDGGRSFWASMSMIFDRTNWMHNLGLLSKPLWKLTLPSTHDSCTYDFYNWWSGASAINISSECNGAPGVLVKVNTCQAQQDTVLQQLRGGIRYIDIRPCKNSHESNNFYTYHYLIAVAVSDVLDQIVTFLGESTQELLIVNVSHFCSFSDTDHNSMITLLKSKLGSYLISSISPSTAASTAFTTTLNTYVPSSGGSKVMLTYTDIELDDNGYPVTNSTYVNYVLRNPSSLDLSGILASLNIYDMYSKSNDLDTMTSDQLDKMRNQALSLPANGHVPTQLFLLSWTLTENAANISKNLVGWGNLHTLSTDANRPFGQYIFDDILNSGKNGTAYKINFIYVDFYNDARAVDYSYLFNQMNATQF